MWDSGGGRAGAVGGVCELDKLMKFVAGLPALCLRLVHCDRPPQRWLCTGPASLMLARYTANVGQWSVATEPWGIGSRPLGGLRIAVHWGKYHNWDFAILQSVSPSFPAHIVCKHLHIVFCVLFGLITMI